jgi:Tol biopolymer transport system component
MVYLETPVQPVSVDLQSGRATRLTPVANRLSLALSPDASKVAYVGAGLGVAPASGGEARQLVGFSESSYARERTDGFGLAWSTDQRYLFFVQPNINAIWRVSSAGGEAEKVWVSPNRIRALRMHPDGSRIAFDSVVDAWELWALENFLPNPRGSK